MASDVMQIGEVLIGKLDSNRPRRSTVSLTWQLLGEVTIAQYNLIHNLTYKHDAIDVVHPSSMQDACHMNFIIDLAHGRVSVAQWQSIEAQGLRFDSSWRLRVFSSSYARDQTKNVFFYLFTKLKTYQLSYSINEKSSCFWNLQLVIYIYIQIYIDLLKETSCLFH